MSTKLMMVVIGLLVAGGSVLAVAKSTSLVSSDTNSYSASALAMSSCCSAKSSCCSETSECGAEKSVCCSEKTEVAASCCDASKAGACCKASNLTIATVADSVESAKTGFVCPITGETLQCEKCCPLKKTE